MGYQEDLSIELPVLDDEEIVVYRDVKDALDLEYDDGIIRRYSFGSVSLNCKEMDLEEYVDQLRRYTRFILGISRIWSVCEMEKEKDKWNILLCSERGNMRGIF